jgi:hypothetical protein
MSQPGIKRRNHIVPKCLLKNWTSRNQGSIGFHYFDITEQKRRFEQGSSARFAVFDYLYVPYRENGQRDDSVEDWFAKDESALALVAKAAHESNLGKLTRTKYVNQAARACIGLGYRSPYQFYRFLEECEKSEEKFGHAEHANAVRNMLGIFRKKYDQFKNWDYFIAYGFSEDLLICDTPFFDWSITKRPAELATMPLGPNALLIMHPPKDRGREYASFSFQRVSNPKIVRNQNTMTIATAREWVVARTAAQIESIASELSQTEVERRIDLDRLVFL